MGQTALYATRQPALTVLKAKPLFRKGKSFRVTWLRIVPAAPPLVVLNAMKGITWTKRLVCAIFVAKPYLIAPNANQQRYVQHAATKVSFWARMLANVSVTILAGKIPWSETKKLVYVIALMVSSWMSLMGACPVTIWSQAVEPAQRQAGTR